MRVDPDSGYRFYGEEQVEKARLVALLRRVDMPLALISSVLAMDQPLAAQTISAHWQDVEQATAERRALVSYVVDQLTGKEGKMYEIKLRTIPERKLISFTRHLDAEELHGFFHEKLSRVDAHPSRLEGTAGAPFLIFYGEVSADSDGPVALCFPVDVITSEESIASIEDAELRTEPLHEEAYIRLARADMPSSEMTPVIDALRNWVMENNREPAGPLRQDFSFTEGCTSLSFAVPLR